MRPEVWCRLNPQDRPRPNRPLENRCAGYFAEHSLDQGLNRHRYHAALRGAPAPAVTVVPQRALAGQKPEELEAKERVAKRGTVNPFERLVGQRSARFHLEQRVGRLAGQWQQPNHLERRGQLGFKRLRATGDDQRHAAQSGRGQRQLRPELEALWA